MTGAAASKRARLPGWREVVAGRYLVEEPIGAGGGGVVVAATHLFLGERVALKLVVDEHATDSKRADRLLREARITAKLRSEHVVRVLDAGIARPGVLFIAMEMLRGMDLRKRLAISGRLPVRTAIEHALEACDALEEAHALGVVHRDVKPSNLFLAARSPDAQPERGEILKVLDFGVSKPASAAPRNPDFTGSDAVIGSLCYMAPEQLSASADVDPRADVWSLAAVLFECLAGNPPYRAQTLSEYAVVLGAGAPPSLRAIRPDVPAALDEAVRRALAIDRDDRPATMRDFAREIA